MGKLDRRALLKLATAARRGALSLCGVDWLTWTNELLPESETSDGMGACRARAALLESLAYDGTRVHGASNRQCRLGWCGPGCPFWRIKPVGFVMPHLRLTAMKAPKKGGRRG